MHTFLTSSLKITSGEISAKEVAGESGGWISSNEHHRWESIKAVSVSKQLQSLQKLFFKNLNQKKRIIQFRPSIHQSKHYTTLSSPTLRSASGQGERPRRQPWVPDAPKIKHNKMKQFYMVDMRRKMWYYHLIKKVRIPLAREGKISLAMKNQTIQRTKNDFAEGWQTRGT